eukprot:jgi/Botrbrau1/21894/Bobra.0249s0023.1
MPQNLTIDKDSPPRKKRSCRNKKMPPTTHRSKITGTRYPPHVQECCMLNFQPKQWTEGIKPSKCRCKRIQAKLLWVWTFLQYQRSSPPTKNTPVTRIPRGHPVRPDNAAVLRPKLAGINSTTVQHETARKCHDCRPGADIEAWPET